MQVGPIYRRRSKEVKLYKKIELINYLTERLNSVIHDALSNSETVKAP
jgi:hypothetical protein